MAGKATGSKPKSPGKKAWGNFNRRLSDNTILENSGVENKGLTVPQLNKKPILGQSPRKKKYDFIRASLHCVTHPLAFSSLMKAALMSLWL